MGLRARDRKRCGSGVRFAAVRWDSLVRIRTGKMLQGNYEAEKTSIPLPAIR
jgi:hypothetical protein